MSNGAQGAVDDLGFQPLASAESETSNDLGFKPSYGKPIADTSRISPRTLSAWERIKNMFSHVPAINPLVKPDDERLLAPEEALTPVEQRRHPIATGVGEFAGGLTSPQNAAIIAATGGLGSLPGVAGRLLPRLVSAGFSAQMLKSAYDQVPAIRQAADRGDEPEVKRLVTQFALTVGTAGLAGRHAAAGRVATPLEEAPAVNTEADVKPTEAAPPATAPRPVRGLLPARVPPGPEDQFQSVAGPGEQAIPLGEGARTAEGAIKAPGRTLEQVRALPAGTGTAEEEFLAGQSTPVPRIPTAPLGGLVEDAAVGFRPARTLDPASITRQSAEQMVREAANFLSQQERPGRYRADISTAPGEMRTAAGAREQDQAWFGVNSLRSQFPWFAEMNETPKQLIEAAQRGKGPVYDRMVKAASDYFEQRQAEAKPYVEQITPQAKALARHVRDVDPNLADDLDRLAAGYFPLYSSLYDFAGEARRQLGNAEIIAEFTRTIDQLSEEEHRAAASKGSQTLFGAGEAGSSEEADREDPLDIFLGSSDPARSRGGEAGFVSPELLRGIFSGRLSKEAYQKLVAEPLIRKTGLGEKYGAIRAIDPDVAEGLHVLDNAPAYFRAKAAQTIHSIIGGLSREQERLFTLMADADSRENLRTQHPQEYAQALRDPEIQEALEKYRPVEQELTQLRQRLGGQTLDQDYLRRIYEDHVAGIGQQSAPGSVERGTTAFDRVIRPQRIGNLSREATAEYHYQHGVHEFGPAFGTKFIGTELTALRDRVARDFISKATEIEPGAAEPRQITYEGKPYYRPDIAREMREAGRKNVQAYDRYDPTAGLKYPQAGASKFLGPRDIVRALNDYGSRPDEAPGSLRRFLQEQTIGFGFGIPHVANILRRVTQSAPLGAANPEAWVRAWKVAFDKGLRERGIKGLDDPTFDALAKQGSVNITDMENLKQYIGGNLNPANWARTLAGVGHKLLFDPKSFGGFGGIDQRARLYIADLVKTQNPELSDSEIARAVNDQLGDYNRANWGDRQKLLAKFILFPGWDASSIRWVIQHPLKTTVPPALLVLTANQVLYRLGKNRDDDALDISNVHFGDRSIGLGILRESMARNLERPLLNYGQARVSGESGARAMGEAARGIAQGAGGLTGLLRPDLTAAIDLAMNRQSPFGGQELVKPEDYKTPGRVLPNRALEKQAALVLRHAVPALDRMLDSNQQIDFRSFVGSNVGLPNYQDGAEQKLRSNVAEAAEVSQTLSRLAKSNPGQARQFIADPDNAAAALFRRDFDRISSALRRIDTARDAISSAKNLTASEKREGLERLDQARQNLLQNADGLNRLLFERKQQLRKQRSAQLPFQGGVIAVPGALPQQSR